MRTKVNLILKQAGSNAKFTVQIQGWVQPTANPGNVAKLSKGRALSAAKALKSLGIKGSFDLQFKGLENNVNPNARKASVLITWSK